MKTKSRLFGWAFALLVVVLTVAPRPAYAANDILVGMFFTSDSDYTNSIYVSYDGKKMTRVATTYDTQGRDGAGSSVYYDSNKNAHYGQMDPSIMYYGGKFWSISGWNRYDGKFWPMISYSTDLVHWTHPEGDVLINGTHGISLNKYPTGFSKSKKGFDTVAPEWFISKNGSVYIIFSAGYYGAFHGDATNDRMQAYMVKVTKLSADEGVADGDTKYLWPQNLTFKTGKAKRISIPGNSAKNANYIDGSMFVNGSTDYLVVKKGGLTNQIYKTSNIDANKWTLVNSKATFGYEGASVAKLGSTFYMAADHVTGATADGVKLFKSTSLTKTGWSAAGTKFVTKAGKTCKVRHGSIIKLKEGTAGWRVAASLMKLSIKKAVVSSIANKTYTGEAITPTLTVKLNGTKLKLNTDYTLKYANNTKVGTATVTITGKGCYTGTKKVTFKIVKAASTVKLVAQTKTYTGKAIAYSGKVTKTGSTDKVTYKYYSDAKCTKAVKAASVKNAGTYYVKATVAANANYKAATSAVAKLTVVAADISSVASIGSIEDQTYTGQAIEPTAIVMLNDGTELVEGSDYVLEYDNNTEVGTATVRVAFRGNYTGSLASEFQIVDAPDDVGEISSQESDDVPETQPSESDDTDVVEQSECADLDDLVEDTYPVEDPVEDDDLFEDVDSISAQPASDALVEVVDP